MSLNDTPSADRTHIGFFGLRNAGKSSLVNALTGQEMSLVSAVAGTTTDPVRKTMELLPLGPVVIVDTPGVDDEGALGEKRVRRALKALEGIHIAVLVVDGTRGLTEIDRSLITAFEDGGVPYYVAVTKADLANSLETSSDPANLEADPGLKSCAGIVRTCALTGQGIKKLKDMMGATKLRAKEHERHMLCDLIQPGDVVVLVTPIDESAPKNRMILPQQMAIREVLDAHGMAYVTQVDQLEEVLAISKKAPTLVVTDSQAFAEVSAIVPRDIPLTSFSILMARYKGSLSTQLSAVEAVSQLEDGDRVLIAEACTHHRQCQDIGTVKIPGWLEAYTGKRFDYQFCSGNEFPEDLSGFKLVIHCGGCMVTEKEVQNRMKRAKTQNVPMTNYGMLIAKLHGILERAMEPVIASS